MVPPDTMAPAGAILPALSWYTNGQKNLKKTIVIKMPYNRRYRRNGGYRRRYKRNYRKRPYKRRYRRKRRGTQNILKLRSPTIVPDRYMVKLNFQDTYTVSTISNDTLFRGNGPRDPQVTAGGNSCLGYTKLIQFWNKYVCTSSKINVTFMNAGIGNDLQVSVLASSDNNTFTDATELATQPYSKDRYLTSNEGYGHKTINYWQSTARIKGVPKSRVINDDVFNAVVNTEPAFEWFWHVFSQDLGGQTQDLKFRVSITYWIQFYDRLTIVED